MDRGRCRACALAFATLSRTVPLLASAPDARDVAREIARSGGAYYDEGAWELARDHFHRAYQLIPAPTLALMEARALVSLGRLVEALAVYEVAATRVIDASNEAFRRAASVAHAEREQLRERVPTLRIEAPETGEITVRLDGRALSSAAVGAALEVDPGTHSLEVQSGTRAPTWESVTVRLGEQRVVQVAPPLDADARHAADHQRVAVWTSLIVGASGALFGAAASAIASHQQNESDSACLNAPCSSNLSEQARGWRTASAIGYMIGGAGAATGAWLFVTLPGRRASSPISAFVSLSGPALTVAGAF